MATLVLDPAAPGLEELKERRRAGLDRLDEVWEGVLHMVPAPHGRHCDAGVDLAVQGRHQVGELVGGGSHRARAAAVG